MPLFGGAGCFVVRVVDSLWCFNHRRSHTECDIRGHFAERVGCNLPTTGPVCLWDVVIICDAMGSSSGLRFEAASGLKHLVVMGLGGAHHDEMHPVRCSPGFTRRAFMTL